MELADIGVRILVTGFLALCIAGPFILPEKLASDQEPGAALSSPQGPAPSEPHVGTILNATASPEPTAGDGNR